MENEPKSTVESDRTTPRNPTKPPKQVTGTVVILPLLLLGGALWLSAQGPEPTPSNDAVPVAPTPVAPTPAPTAKAPKPRVARLQIFVPDDNGKLVRKDVPFKSDTPDYAFGTEDALREAMARSAVNQIIRDVRDVFPPNSRVLKVRVSEKVATVDMNAAFAANAESWSSAEAVARVMSIVNSVAATDESITNKKISVLFTIEGKKMETLGPMDTGEPLEADESLVTKA